MEIKEVQKYAAHTIEQLQLVAAEKQCDLVVAGCDQLLIDIDSDADEVFFQGQLKILAEKFLISDIQTWRSRNGGFHHVITLPGMNFEPDEIYRIALQAALGSDRKRELIALDECTNSSSVSTLFRPKEATVEVQPVSR